jgi:hypothetical protein
MSKQHVGPLGTSFGDGFAPLAAAHRTLPFVNRFH